MKTYLSIDLDFWNYHVAFDVIIPDPWSKIASLITSRVPIFVVKNHDELIDHANKYSPDKIINVDFHDDLGDGERTSKPSCANWPMFVRNAGDIRYIWRHPHVGNIAPGICNESQRFPEIQELYKSHRTIIYNKYGNPEFVLSNADLRKIKKMWKDEGCLGFRSKTMAHGFPVVSKVEAIGISISPPYTISTSKSIIDAAKLLLGKENNIEMEKSTKTAIEEFISIGAK